MADLSGKKIDSPDFNPEKYVKELSQRCVGKIDLVTQRQKMQTMSDETKEKLKNNVYENYVQFINTSKEISVLANEMYQLNHLLSEQRELLSSLLDTSIVGSRGAVVDKEKVPDAEDSKNNEEEQRRKLASIIEKVEGCVSLLEVPGRVLLHDSDLIELDINDNSALHRYHGYLLNDSVVLASWITNRRGPVRYKFQVQYPLDSLAVVNVRDLGNIKHAFKFLAFPDTRLFQCSTSANKSDWMKAFELAKKSILKQNQQMQRESVSERPVSVISRGDSTESNNPFEEPVPEPTPDQLIPDWLLEAPDDLDVFIAQRHFGDAYNLIMKCKEEWVDLPPSSKLHLIQRKIDERIRNLTEVLMKELEVSPERSFQGGLRAARRAVLLLNQLGCSTQACKLFLELSSSVIKTQLKRTMREGVTVQFITQLGVIFFTNVKDVMQEFLKVFPTTSGCLSSFVVWAGLELTAFVTLLNKHIFLPQSSLDSIAECFTSIRKLCAELCELGLDLVYMLDGLLRSPLTRAIQDNTRKTVDSIRLKAADDTWRQTNLMSKDARSKFVQEFVDLGLTNTPAYTYGETWVFLTSNTISFTRRYLQLVDSSLSLCFPELEFVVRSSIESVLNEQLKHVQESAANKNFDKVAVEKNGNFLVGELLPLVLKKFSAAIGHQCEELLQLEKKYSNLAPRSVTKYSTTVYI